MKGVLGFLLVFALFSSSLAKKSKKGGTNQKPQRGLQRGIFWTQDKPKGETFINGLQK